MGLLIQGIINRGVGHGPGRGLIVCLGKNILGGRQPAHKCRVGGGKMSDHQTLMNLRSASQLRRNEGDADASAEIPHEIVKTARIADLLLGQLAHGRSGEGNKDETDGDTVDDARPDHIDLADLKVEPA